MAPIKPPAFDRLQTRLTVVYAALFALAMIVLAVAVYGAVSVQAKRSVRAELSGGGAVFDRLWQLKSDQLEDGAALLARDPGFRAAFATGDAEASGSALENLRSRLGVDRAFVVAADGALLAGAGEATNTADSAAIAEALIADENAAGVITLGPTSYQAISAPILAPALAGWVVFAARLDDAEMRNLEELSSIPLEASIMHRNGETWLAGQRLGAADAKRLGAFVEEALASQTAQSADLTLRGGAAIALVKPLKAMDSRSPSVLVLQYPLARALAPYRTLLGVMVVVGLASLVLLMIGSWLIALRVTRPIIALDDAAQRLQQGEDVEVVVQTDDEIGRLAQSFNIMAAEIRARERRITNLALHDVETGLPNRLAMERVLAEGPGSEGVLFLAACGIDRFAEVRGAIGHALSGRLMGEFGRRLAGTGLCGAVGRLSSDVIGAVFSAADSVQAAGVAERIIRACETPIIIDGAPIDISLSVGLAGLPLHGRDPQQVIDRASIALDQARKRRTKSAVFDAADYGDPAANLSLMSEMLSAIERGDLAVHYQPKLDLRRDEITGVEALVRWTHPVRGPLSPDLFVGMAEETGQIRALTDFVIDRAMQDQRRIAAAGHALTVSVNISGRVLGDAAFGRAVLPLIARRDGPLCFEITETAVIENEHLAFELLDALSAAGVEISIDDYGSGLSSLAYLKRIRAGELKIDRAFISDMIAGQRESLLVRSTIDLAHALGMRVTAEGVEDDAVRSLLTVMGCDLAQGYGVGRPMAVEELLTFLDESARSRQSTGVGRDDRSRSADGAGAGRRAGLREA